MAVVGKVIGMTNHQVTPSPFLVDFQRGHHHQVRQAPPRGNWGVPHKMQYKAEREEDVEVVSRGRYPAGGYVKGAPSPMPVYHNPYAYAQTNGTSSPFTAQLTPPQQAFKLNGHAAPFTPQAPGLFLPTQEGTESETQSDTTEARGRPLESSFVASARSRSATSSASSTECSVYRPRSHSEPPVHVGDAQEAPVTPCEW